MNINNKLFPKKTLIYDCETINCIPNFKELPKNNVVYCKNNQDYLGMGISVIGVYCSWTNSYYTYTQENLLEFQSLINQSEEIVGFNSIYFDDNLCNAHGINIKTTYDLLCQVRLATGMPANYVKGVTRSGYSLNDLAKNNLNLHKSCTGELAPILWQQGKKEEVIKYCLNDVNIIRQLYEKRHNLIDPTNGKILNLDNHQSGLKQFTQEIGKTIPQDHKLYEKYLNWLQQTYGNDKGTFIHYLHRYYNLTWDEYWQKNEEDRWRIAYRILDKITDFGFCELPAQVKEDLKKCPTELTDKFWNRLWE